MAGALVGWAALVTGGSRGIGRAVAAALVGEGASVLIAARGRDALVAAAAELGAAAFAADVSTVAGVDAVAAAVRERFGRADVVVHAAGGFALAPAPAMAVETFDALLAVNLRAAFLLARTFLPEMIARRAGHFLSIGSIAGRRALPGNAAYAASKFGLRGLHAVLSAELRGTGVRATLVEAAATDTPLWDGIDPAPGAGVPSRSAMLRPEAVADAVLYAVTRPPETAVPNIIIERN